MSISRSHHLKSQYHSLRLRLPASALGVEIPLAVIAALGPPYSPNTTATKVFQYQRLSPALTISNPNTIPFDCGFQPLFWELRYP